MRGFLFALISIPAMIGLAGAQTTDSNPAHAPDVFLSNQKHPKQERAPTARTVTGQVTDVTGKPLEGALVTLTDTKTNDKTEFFTKKNGRYSFADLSFTVDYEVQARYKDSASELRKLSQYDHTAKLVRILEIQPTGSDAKKAPDTVAKKDGSQPKQ